MIVLDLGFNVALDQLAMANSVQWHAWCLEVGLVMRRILRLDFKGQQKKSRL